MRFWIFRAKVCAQRNEVVDLPDHLTQIVDDDVGELSQLPGCELRPTIPEGQLAVGEFVSLFLYEPQRAEVVPPMVLYPIVQRLVEPELQPHTVAQLVLYLGVIPVSTTLLQVQDLLDTRGPHKLATKRKGSVKSLILCQGSVGARREAHPVLEQRLVQPDRGRDLLLHRALDSVEPVADR